MPSPPSSRAQRAQRTRDAILDSARREFARRGYEQATVRAIAAGAGIDPSMVIRYFGDKHSLFLLASGGQLQLPDLRPLPVRRRGRTLVEYFVGLWSGPAAEDRFRMLLMSAATEPAAARRMRSWISEDLLPMVRDIAGDRGAEARAGLIASALLGLAVCRLVLLAPEITGLPDDELVPRLAATIDRYLTMPAAGLGPMS
jgi:AcrR family transcriptional regulator